MSVEPIGSPTRGLFPLTNGEKTRSWRWINAVLVLERRVSQSIPQNSRVSPSEWVTLAPLRRLPASHCWYNVDWAACDPPELQLLHLYDESRILFSGLWWELAATGLGRKKDTVNSWDGAWMPKARVSKPLPLRAPEAHFYRLQSFLVYR